jgi:hypothetical protein
LGVTLAKKIFKLHAVYFGLNILPYTFKKDFLATYHSEDDEIARIEIKRIGHRIANV